MAAQYFFYHDTIISFALFLLYVDLLRNHSLQEFIRAFFGTIKN